jgi:molybdate transport system regulatory protein
MSPARAARRNAPRPLTPRVKVWLECPDGRYAFGLGISEILLAVDRAGSIKQAARHLGKSYRHVWGRVKEAEAALSQQLVVTQVGGEGAQRSTLTPAARQLAQDFLAVRQRMQKAVAREFAAGFAWPVAGRRLQ